MFLKSRPERRENWLEASDLAVSLADPHLPDQPLTLVNDAFCRLTSYVRSACLGSNCRFLQGEGTDPAAVRRVRAGIEALECRLTVLRNYRADGRGFDNALLVGPLFDHDGGLTRLFGLQWDLGRTLDRRSDADGDWSFPDPGRQIANVEAIVARLVSASRAAGGHALGVPLLERLVALGRPQQYPPDDRLPNWTRASSLLDYLLAPYGARERGSTGVDGRMGVLAADAATPLALAVHEFARLSERVAVASETDGPGGSVLEGASLSCDSCVLAGEPGIELHWSAPVAPLRDEDGEAPHHGIDIATDVVRFIGGDIEVAWRAERLDARVVVPNRPYALGEADAGASNA